MKKLEDFDEDINKCSKCGLCQSVCPVYKVTGNDCAVSRGKFIMLKGVLDGDLELNKNINKYLDLCLKCGKCTEFCPSGIDVVKIFECAKHNYFKKSLSGKIIGFLESRWIFNSAIHFLKLFKIQPNFHKKGLTKLLYFKGCVNEVYPKVEKALKKVLAHYDVELIEKPFECCGLPFLSSGNIERYDECADRNSTIMDCDYDYLLTDCASCSHTIKNYKNAKNLINIGEFLASSDKKFIFEKPVKVTFHKPCHLDNADFLKPMFEKCENVEYIEMEGWDECCGFAGEFAIKNNKISRKIGAIKAQNILNSDVDFVLTICPACIMGIHQGFLELGKKAPKILNLVEFLALAKNIV